MSKPKEKVPVLCEVKVERSPDLHYRLQKVLFPLRGTEQEKICEQIRIAYWLTGKKFPQFAPILLEKELAILIGEAIKQGVLTTEFVKIIRSYISKE